MAKSASEFEKTSSFDELMTAGIAAIAARGVDKVTVADVITISGHSRPTFYSYFGDINGLLAEIWIKHGRSRLELEVNEPNDLATPTAPMDGLNSVLLQIMCVSHRVPELQEVVVPDMADWWAARTKGNTYIELRTAWILSVQLGIAVSLHVDPNNALASAVLPVLRSMPDDFAGSPLLEGLGQMPDFPQADPVLADDSSVENAIMKATIEVIANSGVGAASVARIARKCRFSTGTIYPRFATGRELADKSFEAAINDVVTGNLRQGRQVGFGLDQYGLTVSAGLRENRRVWRDYRLEMHIAALHDAELAAKMKAGFEVTRQMLVESIEQVPSLGARVAQPLSYLMQVIAIGLSLLHNVGIPVQALDHRIVVRYVGAAFAQAK